jgi:hypothetical protein
VVSPINRGDHPMPWALGTQERKPALDRLVLRFDLSVFTTVVQAGNFRPHGHAGDTRAARISTKTGRLKPRRCKKTNSIGLNVDGQASGWRIA